MKSLPVGFNPIPKSNKKALEVIEQVSEQARRIVNPSRNMDEAREIVIRDGAKAFNKIPKQNIPNLDEYTRGYTMALQGKVPAEQIEVHKMNAILTGNTSFLEGLKAAAKNQ